MQRRRRCFIAPAPGRPLNSSAAPDVRAPSVRGRWHFKACFGPFLSIPNRHGNCALASHEAADIRLPMNEAIRPGPESLRQAVSTPQLAVIVPTFNERDNVTTLFRRLEVALAGVSWEVVFVDDNSPDGTWDVVRGLARQDSRVRCIRRIGRRGLSGACIEGILASSAPYVAVIDADLQHDETQLPKMLLLLASDQADLVVGSRYIEGYKSEGFNKQRAGASALATEVAKKMLRVEIADPMSGFFMVRRDRFEQLAPKLSVHGFKILLDLVATAQGNLRAVEIPYTFGARQHGESKLDSMVALDFLGLVLAKLTNDIVSLRFILFAMVGGVGLLANVGVAFSVYDQEPIWWLAGMAGALMGVVWNYAMSGLFVWRKK